MSKVVVLIPCYNEELTIAKVVTEFKEKLPEADIFVYDNGSTDNTVAKAIKAGANVKFVEERGKGNVIKAMLEQIDADCYVIVDGDATYDIENVDTMVERVIHDNDDLVLGSRLTSDYFKENKNFMHTAGNKFLTFVIKHQFGKLYVDLLTGFRALSKNLAASFVPESKNFEIEAEMTLFALANDYKISSVHSEYVERPEGSYSKIRFVKDGYSILRTVAKAIVHHKGCTVGGASNE